MLYVVREFPIDVNLTILLTAKFGLVVVCQYFSPIILLAVLLIEELASLTTDPVLVVDNWKLVSDIIFTT